MSPGGDNHLTGHRIFDMRKGQSFFDPGKRACETIRQGSNPESTGQGPYVAETFPVTVEEGYVLIEA
jgi:hypothetical protein